jgi:iron only hydrogenase large subunit-like protein
VQETAFGAKLVSQAYVNLIDEGKMTNIITTACPAVDFLIEKEYGDLTDMMAPVVSPLIAHGRYIKERHPDAKVVFLSPCIAKFKEIRDPRFAGAVDACISMEELVNWVKDSLTEEETDDWADFEGSIARLYPTPGGIIKTMDIGKFGYTFLSVDGVENCMAALRDIEAGKLQKCFIEMSACVGGCVGGPVMEKNSRSPIRGYLAVSEYAGKNDFEVEHPDPELLRKRFECIERNTVMPTEYEIMDIRIVDENCSNDDVFAALSRVFPEGLEVLEVADRVKKAGEVAFAEFLIASES